MEYKEFNTSELAGRIAKKLKLGRESTEALYGELSQLGNGPVKSAFDSLVGPEPQTRKFIAVIKESSTRDVQYEKKDDTPWHDDGNWVDKGQQELYLGIVNAETEPRAKQIAAGWAGTDVSVIKLYEI